VQENDKPVLVYSTFPSHAAAEAVGRELVERRLAACVNILPGITSIYRWEGSVARDSEVAMIIKTRASLTDEAMQLVRSRHTYTTPALLVLPVTSGSADYVQWILSETRDTSEPAQD